MLDFSHVVRRQLLVRVQDFRIRASVMFSVTPFKTAAMTLMKPAQVRYYILLAIHSVHVRFWKLSWAKLVMSFGVQWIEVEISNFIRM